VSRLEPPCYCFAAWAFIGCRGLLLAFVGRRQKWGLFQTVDVAVVIVVEVDEVRTEPNNIMVATRDLGKHRAGTT
jgi:hypothetical protein